MEQELRDLGSNQTCAPTLQIWCLMASLLTPKRPCCCCCYYHQLWPWFAKHFYFASCLNASPFWHDSQTANRCFQLCLCLFCFLFNGLFPRWGFNLWHDLLLGWHFRSFIAYPTGKRSQPIQVSTAPNAERIEADKTTGNTVWRTGASAVKQRQDLPETEFLTTG